LATNPTPSACLKCNTPLVPGAAFCGTCGTPAGAPGRTAVNVSLKPNYASLLPGALIAIAIALITFIFLQKAAVDATAAAQQAQTQAMMQNPYAYTPVQTGAGIGYFLQPWMVFLLVALGVGLAGYLLGGPMLDKNKRKLMMALQSVGASPPGMPGMAHQGFGPQALPAGPAGPSGPAGPAPGTPPPATPFEQLRKLAELRDSGAISVDDFEKAKADILKKVA
jgi:preprotein translocase subunit SecG